MAALKRDSWPAVNRQCLTKQVNAKRDVDR